MRDEQMSEVDECRNSMKIDDVQVPYSIFVCWTCGCDWVLWLWWWWCSFQINNLRNLVIFVRRLSWKLRDEMMIMAEVQLVRQCAKWHHTYCAQLWSKWWWKLWILCVYSGLQQWIKSEVQMMLLLWTDRMTAAALLCDCWFIINARGNGHE